MVNNNFNIAIEVSPILAASGTFGDKSGVYRLNLNLVRNLSRYFKENKLKNKIYLYTLNPSLLYNVSSEISELLENKNVKLLHLPYLTHDRLQDKPILNRPYIRYFVKKIDVIYEKYLENSLFSKYLQQLTETFKVHDIKIVHHSETGFFPAKGLINVIHINDLTPIKFPFWQKRETIEIHKMKLNFAIYHCQGIVCISENTKKDLIEYAKEKNLDIEKKIAVIYPEANKFPEDKKIDINYVNSILNKLSYGPITAKKYFLYFGTIEPRKNVATLVSEFDQLARSGQLKDFKLVVMGGKGWGKTYEGLKNYINENYPLKVDSPIIHLDFLNDYYLGTLIKNAYAVVYPSLYEGFGLPIVESLQYGIPVITSDTSSMREAGGMYAIYIDPKKPKSLANAILTIFQNSKRIIDFDQNQNKNIENIFRYYMHLND